MTDAQIIKLTSFSSSAGCAAKLGQEALAQVVRHLPAHRDRRLLVGSATGDDAGVFRLDRELALVQTVDFFPPVVDEPYAYGQIAAANALSDVYAMGGRPVTAMNVLGVPDTLPPAVVRMILRGGAAKVKEARCSLVGGHTIRSPEPIYGLSVTGIVSPRRVMTNAAARAGDCLILTKPLGAGIATTAIKRGICSPALAKRAVAFLRRLNTAGAAIAEAGLVRAATDVTGFGLLGHLASMCRASGVGAEIECRAVPLLSKEVAELIGRGCVPGGTKLNLRTAEAIVDWGDTADLEKVVLTDAQTSGGLLLCVAPKNVVAVTAVLKEHRAVAAQIGRIVRSKVPRILVR